MSFFVGQDGPPEWRPTMSFPMMTLAEAREAAERARHAMTKVREKTEQAIGYGLEVAEVSGTAFAMGYANGRWGGDKGEVTMFGIPLDLGLGIGMTGVALLGGFGRYAEHGVNVGAGAIGSYAYRTGFEIGSESANVSAGAKQLPAADPHVLRGANSAKTTSTAGEWGGRGQAYTVFEPQGA
jgi:hypothetical protein